MTPIPARLIPNSPNFPDMFKGLLLFLCLLVASVSASPVNQDYSVTLSWRSFGTVRSLQERISISQKAIDTIVNQLNTDTHEFNGLSWWQSANAFAAMANHDYFAKTTTNKDTVINNLNAAFELHANYDKYGWWATSAVYAHRAYGDNNVLQHAIDTWNHIRQFVQGQNSQRRAVSAKFQARCSAASLAGGVLWRPEPGNGANSITTGLFTALSAYLAEITGDSKYKDAAITSAKWIESLTLEDYVVDDGPRDCGSIPPKFTYNSGKFIEGLSVLAGVTGDSHWSDLLADVIQKTVKYGPWQGNDGIITEGSDAANSDFVGFKAIQIRGLAEAIKRHPYNNRDLDILIHSYVDVQYNALLDLASKDNQYSNNWHGPAPDGYIGWGQLPALDVLVGAIIAN